MWHGKQDAKAIFDGYNQQLCTKSVKQTRRAPKKISESILADPNIPTTLSQADLMSCVNDNGSLAKFLTTRPNLRQ